MKLKSNRIIAVSCLICMLVISSCSKKNGSEAEIPSAIPPQEEKPEQAITEMDITNLGTLSVNIENTGGKSAKEGSLKLVDNDIKTKFLIFSYAKTFFMQMTFPEAKKIGSYTITSGDDADDRDPQSWTITASNDGIEWIELNTQPYEYFPERGQTKKISFKNPAAYRYYRLNVTDLRGGALCQLAEWRLIQVPDNKQTTSLVSKMETIVQGKNTLVFVDKSPDLSAAVKAGLINVFKENYQKEADLYNVNATNKVVFVMEPLYKGVAAAFGGAIIRYDPSWFKSNPKDLDVATHEMMHVVQAYPYVADAGWVTEGIADYVRFTMGLSNAEANWSLPNYSGSQSYKDAYRVTARFFYWLEKHGYAGIVVKLDSSMRSGAYMPSFWTTNTGKTVDQLWADYGSNPAL